MGQLLLIAGEQETLAFVQAVFEHEGFQVQASRTGNWQERSGPSADPILLDVLASPGVGRAALRQWQQRGLTVRIPLLLFCARLTAPHASPDGGAGSSLPSQTPA